MQDSLATLFIPIQACVRRKSDYWHKTAVYLENFNPLGSCILEYQITNDMTMEGFTWVLQETQTESTQEMEQI